MSSRRTWFWVCFLGGAAALALAPEYFAEPPVAVVEPVARSGPLAELGSKPDAPAVAARPAGAASPTASGRGASPAPSRGATSDVDLFAARSWYVAPPAPPPVAVRPPAAPAAPRVVGPPPLPFQFVGKMHDSDQLRVFLLRGAQLHSVKAGDVIDGQYRVESISGTQMNLVYLPLQAAQTLTIGTAL